MYCDTVQPVGQICVYVFVFPQFNRLCLRCSLLLYAEILPVANKWRDTTVMCASSGMMTRARTFITVRTVNFVVLAKVSA